METPVIDVLVVGGGPVGLFMANELARHGIKSFRILEKLPAVSTLSKAVAVHARSLEVVPQVDKFLAQGLKCRGASIYAGAKRLAHVTTDKVHSEYQFALMLPQDETEQIFLDNLKDVHGVTVERGYEVTSLAEFTRTSADDKEETLVRVSAKNLATNSEEVILARYVIGCDGARSLVRKTMKANFVGVTVNDAWLTADCQIKEDFPSPTELTTVIHEKGFVAFFPLKEQERRFRIAINFGEEFTSALDKEYTLEELQDIVNERSSAMGHHLTFYNPRWISLFKLNERRVETMRKSRLMVCGDAAHVHTPAGGQGMNTGIQDAHNLAWKLALVLKGHGKEDVLLDSFSFEREHNADNVLKNTAKMRNLISTNSKVLQALRNTLLPIVSEIEAVQESISNNMGQMDISYPQSSLTSHYGEPRGFFKLFKSNSPSQFLGARLPYFHLTDAADAKSKSSHDIVKATTRHHVFILNDDEGEHKSVDQLQHKLKEAKLDELVQTEVITNGESHVSGVQVWRDDTKEFHKAFHLEEHSKGLAVLVRPDGYIGFISGLATADIDAVVSHLKNYLV